MATTQQLEPHWRVTTISSKGINTTTTPLDDERERVRNERWEGAAKFETSNRRAAGARDMAWAPGGCSYYTTKGHGWGRCICRSISSYLGNFSFFFFLTLLIFSTAGTMIDNTRAWWTTIIGHHHPRELVWTMVWHDSTFQQELLNHFIDLYPLL